MDQFRWGQGMKQGKELPVVRIAELEIDPLQLDAYKVHLKDEIEASLALEAGVVMLSAVGLQDRADHIRILEVYASRKAYESHLQTPHFLRYKNATAGMVRSLTLLDTQPVCMRSNAAIHL
jgi:quinol monooxygenase YgiN